jgi:Hemolysin activation/secretion protein
MVDKGNQKWGELFLQIAAGILASSSTVWPVKAQTVPLFPIEDLNERPDFITQTPTETQNPNLSEPLVPQTVPSGPNLPQPANPSPSLQERKTEPNPDSSQLYECPLPVRSPEPQTPQTQTPEDSKTNEVIEAISVTNFRFIGNTVFSQQTLETEITSKFLRLDSNTNQFSETKITFPQLQQLISEVTKFYNDRGYINSFAYIPTTSEEPNQRLQNRGAGWGSYHQNR